MSLLLGAWTIGLILSFLAFGVYISFRIFDYPDITADGSFALGGAVAASLIAAGSDPFTATFAATVCGFLAGALTGIIHSKFGVQKLLSGILVMTGLYSVNLHVMGRSNIPLLDKSTLATLADDIMERFVSDKFVDIGRWSVARSDVAVFIAVVLAVFACGLILYMFMRTNIGTAMRATGDNAQMITALGVNTGNMIIFGLAMSNALIAFAGAMLAQYQGFADVQMGIGMVVWGLASVIIGEALVGRYSGLGFTLIGAVMGAVVFRLIVAIALRWGLNPNDLKLITAVFVFFALITPGVLSKVSKRVMIKSS